MKVLHILYSGIGGVFNVVDSLINDEIDKKDSTIYIGPNLSRNSFQHKKLLKNNFFYIKTIKYLTVFYFVKIFNKIKKFQPDVIVLHNYHILPCLISKFIFNQKIIYVDHKPFELKRIKDFIIIFFFQFFIDSYVSLNNDNYNYLKKIVFSKKKIKKISNGVDLKYFSSKLEKNFFSLKLGMAARMNNTKLQNILINAVQSLIKKNVNITCYLAGYGENFNNLKKLVSKNNRKKIIFSGSLNQVQLKKWYNKINLYVQASKGEGMSISILQAMAMGIPVMGSNVSGINNLKHPSRSNKMIFANNENDLEKKILNFFELNFKLKKRIISEQKKYLNKNYSEDKMRKRYYNLYKDLISQK